MASMMVSLRDSLCNRLAPKSSWVVVLGILFLSEGSCERELGGTIDSFGGISTLCLCWLSFVGLSSDVLCWRALLVAPDRSSIVGICVSSQSGSLNFVALHDTLCLRLAVCPGLLRCGLLMLNNSGGEAP